jgi:MFS transporter, DHA2 family, multidrug resistance protein
MPDDGLPPRRRRWAVASVLLAVGMSTLLAATVNVALPGMARDLGVEPAAAVWVINAYQLAVVATLLPFASLGDSIGHRRVFFGGLVVLALASAACALATSLPVLVAARLVQGIGGAAAMSVQPALMRFSYPASMLGRAIALTAMTVAVSMAAGPSVAAAVLAVAPWPWLFAVAVPAALVALAMGVPTLPRDAEAGGPARGRFDPVAAALNAAAFGLVFAGMDALADRPVLAVLALAGGFGAGFLLLRRQANATVPLLPIDLLRIPAIAVSVAASVCIFAGQMAAFIALPFLLHDVLGRNQVETGLLITPWPIAVALMAPLVGRMADRVSTALLCALGGVVMGAGLVPLAAAPEALPTAVFATTVAVSGVGFGLFQTPNNRAMLGAAPRARSGGAGGMQGTARLTGQMLGTTLMALTFRIMPEAAPVAGLVLATGFSLAAGAISLARRGAS